MAEKPAIYSSMWNHERYAKRALETWFPNAKLQDIESFLSSPHYMDINWGDENYSMGLKEEFKQYLKEKRRLK
jgi:chromosomal replication initiation ATPase DnaA